MNIEIPENNELLRLFRVFSNEQSLFLLHQHKGFIITTPVSINFRDCKFCHFILPFIIINT